jgi:hypothetical protein
VKEAGLTVKYEGRPESKDRLAIKKNKIKIKKI